MQQLDNEAVEAFDDQQKKKAPSKKQSQTSTFSRHGVQSMGRENSKTSLWLSWIISLATSLYITGRVAQYDTDTVIVKHSVDRHPVKYLHKTYSIIHDTQVAPSRENLKTSRKFLKGNKH